MRHKFEHFDRQGYIKPVPTNYYTYLPKTQAKVYGTPSNLSPQLVALLPSRRGSRSLSPVSSADDIWALGISIYQILSDGNYPFTTNDNVVSALLAISRLTQEDLTKAINALESNDRLRRLCDSNSLFVLISVLNYLLVLDPTDRSTGAKDALDFLNRFDRYSLDHLSLDQTRSESTSSVTIVESPPILEGSPLTTRSSEVSTPPSELEVVEFIPRRNPLASPPLSRPPIRGAESPFSLGIAMISPRMISPRRVTVFGRSPVAPTLQPEAPAIPSRPRIRLENAIALDQLCSGEQRILPRRPEGIPTYQRPGNSRRRQILLVPRERINSLSAPGYPTSS